MGLAERRVIEQCKKAFEETTLPQLTKYGSFKLPATIDVVWDDIYQQLCNNEVAFADAQIYLQEAFYIPLQQALTSICADAMGREAIAAGLKKVIICCTSDKCISYSPNTYVFQDGVLTLDHANSEIEGVSDVKKDTMIPSTNKRIDYLTVLLEDNI